MKKWIMTAIAVATPASFAGDADQQIIQKLEQLQRTVMEQQAQINTLKADLAEQSDVSELVRSELDSAIEAKGLAQVKDMGPVIQLPKQIEGLKIKGDVRFRYERRDEEFGASGESTRDRYRTRFRLGGVWQTNEGWEIGAGLATGDGDGTSTNDTWSDGGFAFDTGDIRLDYAYAKHSWDCWSLTVGQHKNPYVSSFLLWDSDLRPTGVTAQYKMDGLFATTGWYEVQNLGTDEASVQMWGAQVGYEMDMEGTSLLVAASYYHYNDGPTSDFIGIDDDYTWNIGDIYAEVGLPVGEASLSLYGHAWMNMGASGDAGESVLGGTEEGDDNNIGYALGLKGKMGNFSAGYAYGRCEADSAPGIFVNSDFGTGTAGGALNAKGHVFELGYKLTKNFSIAGTAMLIEEIEDNNDEESNLYQIDLKYKF